MFTIHCPVEGAEVLRGPRSILSMHNTSEGVVSYVRCVCGQIAVMRTGRYATEPTVHHPVTPAELAPEAPVAAGVA